MQNISFVFPGQGSQIVGMGKKLCEEHSIAKQIFEQASDIVGFDLMKLCFEGSMDELTETKNAQPAILTHSVAAFKVAQEMFPIKPVICAGHSLGEISALTCAGAIDFADAVAIVKRRGELMQASTSIGVGAMAAISGVDADEVHEECQKNSSHDSMAVISNYNSANQIVISGHKAAVVVICETLKKNGAKVAILKVSAPFHSPLMESAANEFYNYLGRYKFFALNFPVISNVDAKPYSDENEIRIKLKKQIISPVRWYETMQFMESQNVELLIEVGPQAVLRNFARKSMLNTKAYSFDKSDDVSKITEYLKSASAFKHTVVTKCIAIVVCTKNRNWDNVAYSEGVIQPYRQIVQLQQQIEDEKREPTVEEMKMALDMLKLVLKTKKVPIYEQIDRFNEVFRASGTQDLFPDFEMLGNDMVLK